MNKLIIIGNGFDLAHGLKTKYSDFLLWYLNNSNKICKMEGSYEDELIGIKFTSTQRSKPADVKSIDDFFAKIKAYSGYELTFKNAFFKSITNDCLNFNWVKYE